MTPWNRRRENTRHLIRDLLADARTADGEERDALREQVRILWPHRHTGVLFDQYGWPRIFSGGPATAIEASS